MQARAAVGGALKVVAAFVVITFVTPVAAAGVILATNLFVPLPAKIPEPEPIEAIQFSHVFDADGNEIFVYRQFDSNIPVTLEDIPEIVKSAVIAAEDRNFYEHDGVDVRGTLRALWADLRSRTIVQGGSTITQQLAKNAYGIGGERSISRKVREAILAAQLDRTYTKEEILLEYLSVVYFGEGAYGVGAAAQTYFGKRVADLTVSEAALLAGIIPAPSRFNPRADSGTAEIRRQFVLDAMLEEGLITAAAHTEATAQTVVLENPDAPPPEGPHTLVLRPRSQASNHFIDYVTQFLTAELGNEELLYRGGLRIETTLDPTAQQAANEVTAQTLEGIEPHTDGNGTLHTMQFSMAAVEPPTGYVRALIGGRDYSFEQTNIAVRGGGGSGRQPGSSFKPFVLAEAFEQGIKPTATYSAAPHTVGKKTFEGPGGTLTLRDGMRKSINAIFTRLMEDVGPDEVVDLANRMGMNLPLIDPAIDGAGIQLALGTRETFPLDMASAYGIFANGGVRVAPTPVLRVLDGEGNVLLDYTNRQGEQVLKPVVADNVTDVLRGVLIDGTAAGKGIGRPAAGKTGTTDNFRDGWFVGYTPTLSTAVFMGFDPPPLLDGPMALVKGQRLYGGTFPATAWQRFMTAALKGVPVTDFNEPAPIRDVATEAKRRARRGFSPAPAEQVQPVDPGRFVEDEVDPEAPPPTTTTSTTSTTEPTSTTTTEPDDGFDLFD